MDLFADARPNCQVAQQHHFGQRAGMIEVGEGRASALAGRDPFAEMVALASRDAGLGYLELLSPPALSLAAGDVDGTARIAP